VKRIFDLLETLDNPNFKSTRIDYYREKVAKRSGSMSNGVRYFLLNKLFGLRPSEIAEMEGMKGSSSIRQLLIRTSDQLKAGEIGLIEFTPQEAAAAKARLDIQRQKRRESHAKKQQTD
jgi:hypothetical protein